MEVLLLLLFWLVCGIGAAIVASSKGRSGCGWLILGLLLGPLGLLISAGMSNVQQQAMMARMAADREGDAAQRRPCPVCAELVLRDALRCRFCGAALEFPAVETPAARPGLASRLAGFLNRHL